MSGSERREQEIDFVVGDQLFGELAGTLAVGLVIVLDQLDLGLVPPTLMPPAALTFASHIFQTTSCFLASSASGPVSASGAPNLIVGGLRRRQRSGAGRNARGENECAGKSGDC